MKTSNFWSYLRNFTYFDKKCRKVEAVTCRDLDRKHEKSTSSGLYLLQFDIRSLKDGKARLSVRWNLANF